MNRWAVILRLEEVRSGLEFWCLRRGILVSGQDPVPGRMYRLLCSAVGRWWIPRRYGALEETDTGPLPGGIRTLRLGMQHEPMIKTCSKIIRSFGNGINYSYSVITIHSSLCVYQVPRYVPRYLVARGVVPCAYYLSAQHAYTLPIPVIRASRRALLCPFTQR